MKAQPTHYTVVLAIIVLTFYGTVLALWVGGSQTLHASLDHVWGVYSVLPPDKWHADKPLPLFDLEGVLSWRDCYLRGLDVMSVNPCDPQGRLSNYSPLFYLLPTGGVRNTIVLGLLLDGAFLVTMPWLLWPSTAAEFAVAALACISHVVLFAVERANIDILMFLLMLVALLLWRRGAHLIAYAVMVVSGLLKFYPLALLVMVARERCRSLLAISIVSTLTVGIFVFFFRNELSRIPHLLPRPSFYGNQFGALLFAYGVVDQLGLPLFIRWLIELPMLTTSLWAALTLASRFDRAIPNIDWNAPKMSLLLGSAITMAGCFYLMDNIDYRAIFLVALFPGLFALRCQSTEPSFSRLLGWLIGATLFCLYSEMLRLGMDVVERLIYGSDPGDLTHELPLVLWFVVREAIWWFEASFLLSFVISFLRHTPLLLRLVPRLQRSRS